MAELTEWFIAGVLAGVTFIGVKALIDWIWRVTIGREAD